MSDELTLEELEEMHPHKVFLKGVIDDKEIYENKIKWIAKKGRVTDWAIYYHEEDKTDDFVRRHGYKLVERKFIERLVPCSSEAYAKYRY